MRRITLIFLILYLSIPFALADLGETTGPAGDTLVSKSAAPTMAIPGVSLIAVVDFVITDSSLSYSAVELADNLRGDLVTMGNYSVMSKEVMTLSPDDMKSEGASGCSTLECLTSIGQSLGVEFVIGGKVSQNADLYTASAILVDVNNKLIANEAFYETDQGVEDLQTIGSEKLVASLFGLADTAVEIPVVAEENRVKVPYRFEMGGDDAVFVEEDLFASPMAANIYSFDTKSPKRAFFYSLILPGAGEYYGESKFKPFIFAGIEVALWGLYFVNDGKGDDKKKEYQDYAFNHYYWWDFMQWWETIPEYQDTFSHRMPWDNENRRPIFNHEYFENIGKYDQFQLGWDDINSPPPGVPGGVAQTSDSREAYLNIRKEANDFYQTANTMIMLSLGNRVISAFDAALTVKNYNKGQKRYAIKLKSHDFGNGQVPMLTYTYRF